MRGKWRGDPVGKELPEPITDGHVGLREREEPNHILQ